MEVTSNIQDFLHFCWGDIFDLVKDAAVYIDYNVAECLHWYTGDEAYAVLKNIGAVSVHEIAMYNFSYVKVHNTKKAVVIAASPESSFYNRTLKIIIEKNDFEEFIVICSAYSSVLNLTSLGSHDYSNSYDNLKENITQWMKSQNESKRTQVMIMYKPIFMAPINKYLFVTPPFGHLMPPINGKFSEECETDVEYFITSFNSLFAYFEAKENIYALGDLSEYIVKKFESSPFVLDRRTNMPTHQGISLIVLDRTLDLCSSTSYNTESLLGRIVCTLPRLTHHQNDVAIDMSSLCTDSEECAIALMVPGCLATKDSELLEMLLVKKQKDILLALNKMLIDMSSCINSPKTRFTTRVSVHSLEKCVQNFRNTENVESLAKFSKKLQHIIAVIQALKSEKTTRIELLIGLEKLVLQNLAVSRDSSSILSQISNIIKTRSTRGLDTENLLILLIHIYALAGPDIKFSVQQAEQLRNSLIDAVYEDIKHCNESDFVCGTSTYYQTLLLLGVTDDEMAKQSAKNIVAQIMEILNLISRCREDIQMYRNLIKKSNPQEMAQFCGILERLVSDLLQPEKPEILALKKFESSIMSAGIRLLLGKKKHPADNPWIIIYVLGGVTVNEAKIVNDLIASRTHYLCPKITLAGSRLLNPTNVLDQVLLKNINLK